VLAIVVSTVRIIYTQPNRSTVNLEILNIYYLENTLVNIIYEYRLYAKGAYFYPLIAILKRINLDNDII
jgi:hypothetical protein